MRSKWLVVLLALFLAIALVACGTDEEGSADAGSETGAADSETGEDAESSEGAESDAAGEVVVEHELGETVITKNPETVVVFDFGILDSLDHMGVDVAGIPQANVPSYLDKFASDDYFNAGGLFEPDFEGISELHPDLIIISGRQLDLYDEFSKIGPTLFVSLDNSNYLESFSNNMRLLGEIFEKEDFIEDELARIDDEIATINEKTSAVENALVILANDGNISAYGPGSRFGMIHSEFGLDPVDENIEVSNHGMNVSFEYLAEMDPEYLFVVDRGAVVGGESSAQQILENDLTAGTRAFENDNVVYLNPEYWYIAGGGLQSVSEMVKAIEEGIQ
ncbi:MULTISPECIES: siderophore ABC transporter substrate-binding protein [Bacillaceae]|uniref:Siderophore ABC transporter substrate-binding protein n=1 Tax=Evansella alkalicola TaxID=745819 RepID=A0ABS6K0R8_9BACI|nr:MULTISPECIES: siderophore ABC transporter substrate-binding protein [Bacillaceae]MBU9722955.1 siderophore ABC transporter substrate-binding protein [Bacillus alkalicola]